MDAVENASQHLCVNLKSKVILTFGSTIFTYETAAGGAIRSSLKWTNLAKVAA